MIALPSDGGGAGPKAVGGAPARGGGGVGGLERQEAREHRGRWPTTTLVLVAALALVAAAPAVLGGEGGPPAVAHERAVARATHASGGGTGGGGGAAAAEAGGAGGATPASAAPRKARNVWKGVALDLDGPDTERAMCPPSCEWEQEQRQQAEELANRGPREKVSRTRWHRFISHIETETDSFERSLMFAALRERYELVGQRKHLNTGAGGGVGGGAEAGSAAADKPTNIFEQMEMAAAGTVAAGGEDAGGWDSLVVTGKGGKVPVTGDGVHSTGVSETALPSKKRLRGGNDKRQSILERGSR